MFTHPAKKKYFMLVIVMLISASVFGKETQDSIGKKKEKKPMFLSFKAEPGFVLQTNDFVKNENIPHYTAGALKFGLSARGDRWEDIAYGMPYFGIGIYAANFHKKELGTPISLYLVQGATIANLTPKISFHYEFNLGLSTNWNTYDRFDNPDNIAISSGDNVHVGANLYFKFILNRHWDLNVGGSLTHFSNGARRMPNKGLNLGSPYVEIAYKFNEPEARKIEGDLVPPEIKKRIDHDFLLTSSSRQIYHSMTGTGLTTQYVDHRFRVFGFSYAPMFVRSYKYKWGPSLDLLYDESIGSIARREQHPVDLQYYDRVTLGKEKDRFVLGLSAKGEIVMPYFSFFANVGYDIIHQSKRDDRLYQIIGVKIKVYEDFFATFGIRATKFSKAQFLFWSVGYTLEGKGKNKK